MLPSLYSISNISRVIDTGSRPVVVLANDLENYACKYDSKNNLINEFVAHQFLQAWQLPVLPAAFVTIKKEHIPDNMPGGKLRINDFDKPAFGLEYNDDALDATKILGGLKGDSYEIGKFAHRLDLLKIALFDYWVANNDRNHNNYNILILENRFIPIDHSAIFDGARLGSQLAQLTDDDSILNSELADTFLGQKGKVEEAATELIKNFPTFVNNCNEILPAIISEIPDQWCDDKALLTGNIQSAIIKNEDWLNETISSFSQLIHKFIR